MVRIFDTGTDYKHNLDLPVTCVPLLVVCGTEFLAAGHHRSRCRPQSSADLVGCRLGDFGITEAVAVPDPLARPARENCD